jgi:hypothetical protein
MDNTKSSVLGRDKWWWVLTIVTYAAVLVFTHGYRPQAPVAWGVDLHSSPAVVAEADSSGGDDDEDGGEVARC